MKQALTLTDLNAKFQKRVQNLVEEYDYQRLQPQTFCGLFGGSTIGLRARTGENK